MATKFDVIVVGGGHAGIEAAHAAAHLGATTALVLPNPDKIGLMPCNPAIGGPGKSQLVFELHALGGVMGQLADQTAIHARTLNSSKGPAVQSLRVQNERDGYASAARHLIEATSGIDVIRAEVAALEAENNCVSGVRLTDGRELKAPSVVLCTGTFLAGVVWYGKQQREAGRQGEAPARYLSSSLRETGHDLLRFKTGTPPRIRSDSVDFSVLDEVPPDHPVRSFTGCPGPKVAASPTWLTRTTEATHELIRQNLAASAMYGGTIEGQGPRYCPSIEDKVVRFADKDKHLLFVEPDGIETSEVYLQGFSSSMPPYLQDDMIRTLPGFEKAVIQRYAYAVEYDAIDPTQLTTSLMSKRLEGLFSAGQLNGTSGYEEAAAQGLIAGINAARHSSEQDLVTVRRDQAYIGILLDDLVRWGINEPYRMLTSRNEYRLLHRQDNAMDRLTDMAFSWTMVDRCTLEEVKASKDRVQKEIERLDSVHIGGDLASKCLRRPGTTYDDIIAHIGKSSESLTTTEMEKVEILVKYASYIERSQKQLAARDSYEGFDIRGIAYREVASLSNEGLEVLERHRPATLGAAQRLRGLRDSDVTAILVHMKSNVSRETKAA